MRIAIIGAGFVGVATCWYLLQLLPNASIKLFDKHGIGSGASGIAAGLLHPYAGAHAKLNHQGFEGLDATSQLLTEAEKNLGQKVATNQGLLRIAVDEKQSHDFKKTAKRYPEYVKWLGKEKCEELIGIKNPGLLISQARVVNCFLYLQGLWNKCSESGAVFQKMEITQLKTLDDFDMVLVTAGAKTTSFSELSHLPISLTKGQLLELAWPEKYAPFPMPISSHVYIVMHPNKKSCFVGATYERQYTSSEPDIDVALTSLLPKLNIDFPFLSNSEVIGCQASLRVSTQDHLPIYGKINERIWFLTGMGSKGLLYHSLYAKKLVNQIITTGFY